MAAPAARSSITRTLQQLIPLKKAELPPVLAPRAGNLYEVLSRTPQGGVGSTVHQMRWSSKQIDNSYWVVTRTKFKCEGKHGKAWGQLYWKGKLVSPREELIRGALKYSWKEGHSKALPAAKPKAPTPTAEAES
ncbi:hypothetical protein BJ165DRAFT_1420374 [Panaeolus papilionaceus]|nr:hypothetical protein BJ165DRAFT_1420374 [Panaeolus papilionaceus]